MSPLALRCFSCAAAAHTACSISACSISAAAAASEGHHTGATAAHRYRYRTVRISAGRGAACRSPLVATSLARLINIHLAANKVPVRVRVLYMRCSCVLKLNNIRHWIPSFVMPYGSRYIRHDRGYIRPRTRTVRVRYHPGGRWR